MSRLKCKGEEDEGRHEDGSRIDPRGDVVINGVDGVKEGVAPIDPSSNSILIEGGVSEDAGEGSVTRPTRSRGTPASSCSQTGSAWPAQASIIVSPGCRGGRHRVHPPPILGRLRCGTHHGDGPQRRRGVQHPLAGHAHQG